MKEPTNCPVGKWSFGRSLCGEFVIDGEKISVYTTRFGRRALFGEGKIAGGALSLEFSARAATEEIAACGAAPSVEEDTAVSYSLAEGGGYLAYGGKGLKGNIVVAKSHGGAAVVGLRERAFEGCASVTGIALPSGLKRIGERAFFGCSSLRELDLPAAIDRIPSHAFFGCSALEEIALPEGVVEIGSYAFEFCRSLRRIRIPASMQKIGHGAFWGCNSLKEVAVADLGAWCAITFEGGDANPLFGGGRLSGGEGTLAEIPSGVESIAAYAFAGSRLEAVRIPRSVKHIHPTAFAGCRSLGSIFYGGTAEEWLAVEKGNFAAEEGELTVICIDGTFVRNGTLKRKK